ncbi:MAG TPA: SpoIID/LytB domain-containing protein [Gaiellaceae bacterium]|nr:SpoIID/LytB domain-containing protein [Gaiellaceae bacterium]
MPRRLVAALILSAVVVLAPATHAAARSPQKQYVAPAGSGALFLISGHGWGHGVGMGQWGAEGYALQGYTYDEILASYYPGTSLGQSTVSKIRVLLADKKKRLTISSDQPITVVDGNGVTHTLAAGDTKFGPDLNLAVDGGVPQALPPPLTFAPAAGSMLSLGRAYRGKLVVYVVNGRLRAVNVLPLEQYLDSVVASEMPSTWLPDALEAQAVASRSFAIASRKKSGAQFDVYPDSRSQAYLGESVETPEATAAVDATTGEVLLYGTKVATAVFSSSTGGWTQSATDAWGGAGAPYLVSVKDPYDGISPYHSWGPVAVPGNALRKALGLSAKPIDATVTRNPSKRVAQLAVDTLTAGETSQSLVPGEAAAIELNLRSTWFSVAVLSLTPPQPSVPVASGSTVTLTGVVRGVKNVVLQERSEGGYWTELSTVTPDPTTGAISVDVTPTATTDYRLATSAYAAAYVRVQVE